MANQLLTLPAEAFLLEEANLPPDLVCSLAGRSVAVEVLDEQPACQIAPQSLASMGEGEFWVHPDGTYWRLYVPARILLADHAGRTWRLPRRWLAYAVSGWPAPDSALPICAGKTIAERLNLPSFWDLVEINIPEQEADRMAGRETTAEVCFIPNEVARVCCRGPSGRVWRLPHDWRRRRIRLPDFHCLLAQEVPSDIAHRFAGRVVSVNYHPGSLCCHPTRYRFRDDEGGKWPVNITDCPLIGYGDGSEGSDETIQ